MRALIAAIVLTAIGCAAQEPAATPTESQTHTQPASTSDKAIITLQPDTRIFMEFRRSISTRTAKSGDGVYFQTSFPVVVNDKVTIPPGTFVQGTLDKINHHGKNGVPELLVKMATMTLPNGYSVGIPGTINIVTNRDYCRYERPEIAPAALGVGIGAPFAGPLIGMLVGHNSNHSQTVNGVVEPSFNPPFSVKGVMIGTGVGLAVGMTTLFTNIGKNVFIEAGAPTEMILDQPLQLDENRMIYDSRLHELPAPADNSQQAALQQNAPNTTCEMPDATANATVTTTGANAISPDPHRC